MQKVMTLLFCLCFYIKPILSQTNRTWDQPAVIKSCSIQVMADLFTATTFIEMEFYNPGKEEMEGLYRFRLLPGQAITAMQLDLHGKYRDASVEEKWKARNAYNTIVGKRIDPALLQMEGLHQYSLRVYPIPAKSSRKVTMTIQQMLKAGATAYEYCFPLQIKDPVGQFSVTIQAQVTSAPYTVTSLLEGSFRKQSNGYAFVQEEQAFSPDGLLAFNIPMQHGKASLCTKFIQGQTHFALRYHRSIPAQLDFKPKKITIYWDASSDIRNRDIEKEISFLRQYTRFYGVQQLTIIPFNQHLLDTAVFTLQGGNHHRWLSYLRSITYDGALQLGAVDLQNTNTDAVLLFSDGKHTYGRLHPKAGKEKLFCITGSMQPNRNALQQLAAPTGGQLIELNSMNMNEAVQMAGKEQIVLMDLASASGKSIVETPLQEQENLLLLTGVMHENVDTLQLTYGNAGTIMAVEKLVLKTNDACATAAIDRIGMLYQFDSIIKTGNWQHILAFGKKHKVVTPHSSMIVLERIEDYVTYDIEPPQELKEACEALYVKKNKVDRWKLFQEWNAYDVLTNVTNRYNQRIRWWDPSHPMIALNAPGRLQGGEKNSDGGMAVKDAPADALQGKAAGLVASSRALHEVVVVGYGQHSRRLNTSSATTVIRHHEFPLAAQSVEQALAGRVPGVQVVAGVPGGSAPVQIRGLSSLSHQQPLFVLDGHPVSGNINDIVHVADIDRIEVMKSVQAAASFGSHGANGVIVVHTKKGSRQTNHYSQEPYRLKDQEDVAYLQEIKAVPKADKWRAYQQLRSYYEYSAGFYLDMAQHFFEAGRKQQAMEILANAAEAGGGSPEILKAIGYTLESWKAFDEAAMIYEQLLQAHPEALVSHRNLAWAYYQKGAYQKAVDLLYQAISFNWEHQELQLGSTKSLLLTELNAIIALHKNEIDISRIDAALLRPLPVDLRIVMDCNKPLYYNQFKMVEPGGKVASHAYYDHSNAKGVFQNKDYYHGMHPAEYEIKTAISGKYTVRLQLWDAYQSNRLLPTMIRIMTFKNFGKKGQAISIENVIVDNQNGVVDIAEVRY